MPNASYSYGYDVDAKYMISNTPEKFKAAYNGVNGLTTEMAQQYVAGTYAKGFTHTSNSMNHPMSIMQLMHLTSEIGLQFRVAIYQR